MEETILRPGRNCWRIAPCRRAAFLVDGEDYYSALATALARARQSVFILGWDFDSRIRLRRSGRFPPLGRFLRGLVARRPALRIHILDWDFSLLFALEREALPAVRFFWGSHPRLRFRLDDRHPVGAAHHQKVVVIDDRLAFAGGFDLTACRWDTPGHLPSDARRADGATPCPPFHDVQMMVDGAAAAALGELARERWQRATGEALLPSDSSGEDPWPAEVVPDVNDVQVAIARTSPRYNGHAEVREIEALYLDAIASARSSLYLENQYFTSGIVAAALQARLAEASGPEIVLVLPRECSGWLEEGTMGVLRARVLDQLRAADRFERLHVYSPHQKGVSACSIHVHSKLMIVDERFLRIGSASLSNRSMGLDTECDLAIEADRPETREALVRFRARLLGEHLGVPPETVLQAQREAGSLGGAIEALRTVSRTLRPLDARVGGWLDPLISEAPILDPESPMPFEQFVEETVSREGRKGRAALAAVLLVMFALAAAWRWTPLGEWVELETLRRWGMEVRESLWAPLLVVGVFVLGGLILLPVTLMIFATALTFTPVPGFLYALAGVLASALVTYGGGRFLGRKTVRRLAGSRLNRLSRQFARRGLIAVILIRVLPIAPFSVVNLIAGASHIHFRDYVLGTLLGMGPGILAITVFEHTLLRVLQKPDVSNILVLGIVLLGAGGSVWLIRRWLARKREAPQGRNR